jgi:hypothetical protein
MKKTFVSLLIVSACFLSSVFGQSTNMHNLNLQIQPVDNPTAFVSSGGVCAAGLGATGYTVYAHAGTWGNGEFSRATLMITDSMQLTPERALRLNFSLNGGNSFQASYGVDVVRIAPNDVVVLAAVNNFVLSNNENLQNLDFALIRLRLTNAGGAEVIWARCYGGDFNDVPHRLIRTKEGHLLAAGYSNPEQALNVPSKMRNYLVKVNINGNLIWDRRYSDGTECNTSGLILAQGMTYRPVCETSDGGYVFTSNCDERIYITKVTSGGSVLWTRRYTGAGGISEGINSEGVGSIDLGAGSFGSIIGIRELSDGRLAFLGNQLIFLAGLLYIENQQQVQLGGVGYPMSYAFIMNNEGVFEGGTAFFREKSFSDPNNPIEMMAQDFAVLPNDHLLIAAGARQYGDANGNTWYHPSLIELKPEEDDVNEAIEASLTIEDLSPPGTSPVHTFFNNDNARGMSGIRMLYQPEKKTAILSSNFGKIWRIADVNDLEQNTACAQPLDRLYSFPFELEINTNPPMTGAALTSANMSVSFSAINTSHAYNCLLSDAVEPVNSLQPAYLAPTMATKGTPIQVLDPHGYWLQARLEVVDMQGRILLTDVLREDGQILDLPTSGHSMFVVRLIRPDGLSASLRGGRF